MATGTFDASSSDTFVPGNKISIEAGYDTKNTLIFEGIITEQSIRIDTAVGSMLEIECHDEAIKMTVGRKTISFTNKKDSDVISAIIGVYSGLTAVLKMNGLHKCNIMQQIGILYEPEPKPMD